MTGTPTEEESLEIPEGALSVMRRGVRSSSHLSGGIAVIAGLGVAVAVSKLVAPVVLQYALDRGVLGDDGVRPGLVLGASLVGVVIVLAASVMTFVLKTSLIRRAERAIAEQRANAFAHVHRLSVADHNETRRGVLLARVTSDADALGRFVEWGMIAWIVQPMVIVGTFVVLALYSWQLALVALITYLPAIPLLKQLQGHMFVAHDRLRSETAEMLANYSESISGAEVVRSYGLEERMGKRLRRSTDRAYHANLRANRYMAGVFVIGDLLGSLALAAVLVTGIRYHESWGLTVGELSAALFLTTLLQHPLGELGETLDNTQAAAAGWRKILRLLDRVPDVPEPVEGLSIPGGPIDIEADNVCFSYRGAETPALEHVDLHLPAGANIAIVGETGSGKTTFAKLLCRLADPTEGEIRLNGAPLHEVVPESRLASVRMVPQDGFLFDVSIRENIRYGRPDADDLDIESALERIHLRGWADKFPTGLDTRVGERGGNLSVGERQLVALARVALADPGLLILDEATSAVDPETDQALTEAIRRLAADRTMVSIAHRLATAESADEILVFDKGRIVERGRHVDLLGQDGPYAGLHAAWLGATGADPM